MSNQNITIQEVDKVASLARLAISDENRVKFAEQLSSILAHIAKLSELNTDNIEPTSHILPISNVFREDSTEKGFAYDNPIKSAVKEEHNHFKVPKIIE